MDNANPQKPIHSQSDDDSEASSRYAVHSRSEIFHILQSVQNRNALVNLSTETTGDAFLSSLIDIDQKQNKLVMDPAQNAAVNERFVRNQQVMFETTLDQVRIYFTVEHVWHCIHNGENGLCIPIPDSIVRLQRRDYFRVRLPSSRPVTCSIPAQGTTGISGRLATTVDDISLGGIAIVFTEGEMNAEFGMVLGGCRLSLPEIGEIEANLVVRNITPIALKKGGRKIRVGCAFTSLSNAVSNSLQRYIMQLERERRAMAS